MHDNQVKNKRYSIVIAGDLLPSDENVKLFERGDSKQLFGEEICNIFKMQISL